MKKDDCLITKGYDVSDTPTLNSRLLGRLRLRHLQLIDVLGRTGNLHRAADEMNITQPAATKILQDVEEVLGTPLFKRSSRGMEPTEIGKVVGESAERILSENGRLAQNVASLKEGGYGQISVGTIMATTPDLLPKVIARLKQRHALMTVNLVTGTSDALLQSLERGDLDIVLGRLTQTRHRAVFSILPLANEELWAFTSSQTLQKLGDKLSIAKLVEWPWVLQPKSSPLRNMLDRIFADAGYSRLTNVVETTSVYATLQLVRAAGMIACLPRSIVAEGIARGDYVRIPLQIPNVMENYGLITRRDENMPNNVREFTLAVQEVTSGVTHARKRKSTLTPA